jgi:predicted O-methyltransferase YrrM
VALTAQLLVEIEQRYAPQVGVLPGVFSDAEVERVGDSNAGGDKMASNRNGYADAYASVLRDFSPKTVVELGVFQGVSMAMWCDLFPDAEVVGLDLEFSRFDAHLPALLERGAFTGNSPTLVKFDAYADVLPRDFPSSIDLFVDDGPHTGRAIANVLSLVGPLISDGGVYVLEDFADGKRLLSDAFPSARLFRSGRFNAALL